MAFDQVYIFYHAPAVARNLGLSSLILKTTPFNRFLRQTWRIEDHYRGFDIELNTFKTLFIFYELLLLIISLFKFLC